MDVLVRGVLMNYEPHESHDSTIALLMRGEIPRDSHRCLFVFFGQGYTRRTITHDITTISLPMLCASTTLTLALFKCEDRLHT